MVLRSVELNLVLVDRFLYACMPWFTSSSVEHDENFFLFNRSNSSTIKDMKYRSTKNELYWSDHHCTQTKFQLDKKMKTALIRQFVWYRKG